MTKAKRFTEASLLGQSIKLLPSGVDAFSLNAVKGSKRVISKLSEDYVDTVFPGGAEYSIPKNTKLGSGTGETRTHILRVESGQELASDFDVDAELSASYAGVTASASAQYSYHSSLSTSKYYAITSVNQNSFQIDVEQDKFFYEHIDPLFVEAAKKLPDWSRDPEVYAAYMKFFNQWGTHIMLACSFGARYQLRVDQEASKTETKESFSLNVRAEYDGAAKIQGQSSVKDTREYKAYLSKRKYQCLVYGGSPSSALILSSAPAPDSEAYKLAFANWAKSLDETTYSNLVNIRVDSLGNVLDQSSLEEHTQIAPKLTKALKYISEIRVLTGTIKVGASGEVRDPEYECYIDGEPGMELKYVRPITTNAHCKQVSDTHLKLRLDNYSTVPVFHGATGLVQVRVTSPLEPAEVHFRKPGYAGYWGIVLDLSPIGPVVKCSETDKEPNRMVKVDNSLCESGTYGQ